MSWFGQFTCAFCGESQEIAVDPSAGTHQQDIFDCTICCRPNILTIDVEPDRQTVHIQAAPEQEGYDGYNN
jgi:hypothetical protein